MTIWRKLAHLLPWVRRAAERDMRDEIASLREMAGPGALGNLALAAEDARAEMTWPSFERLVQDVRYGLRALTRDKLFALVAIASLALGIGANTAIFSFLDSVILRSLPVRDPDALVVMKWRAKGFALASHGFSWSTGGTAKDGESGMVASIFPYPALAVFQAQTGVFETAFGYFARERLNVMVGAQTESLRGQFVSGTYFDGMGVVPVVGRAIQPDDDRPGASPVAVVSYRFAVRRFGGAAAALGQPITVESNPQTIVGVAPAPFFGAEPGAVPDVYLPLTAAPFTSSNGNDDHFYWLEIMGRLKPGVTAVEARARLTPVFLQYVNATATDDRQRQDLPRLDVQEGATGLDSLRRAYAEPIFVLMAMVAVILLIACMNVANLLLARGVARRREIAVRLSLGASRWRVIRQLLTESVLLSAIGAIVGVLLARWSIPALTSLLASGRDNFTLHASLDSRVLAVTLALSIATGVLFGLAPAVQATRVDVAPALKDTGGLDPRPRSRQFGLRSMLVVAQVAFSLLLLVSAGLFDRTLARLHAIPLGIDREHVLLFTVRPSAVGYKGADSIRLYESLQEQLRQVPRVAEASLSSQPLPMGGGTLVRVTVAGAPADTFVRGILLSVGPGFFETMRMPIVAGREFTSRDRDGAPAVVIVNRRLAAALGLPDPVGRLVDIGGKQYSIAGVADNAVSFALKDEGRGAVFLPYLQGLSKVQGGGAPGAMTYEVRTSGDPLSIAAAVRETVWKIDGRLAIDGMTTQAAHVDEAISTEIALARLCSAFGALALVIACVGLYGNVAFAVARRTHEIGIRSALGASGARLVWMVLRDVVAMAILGLVLGLPLVFAGSRYVKAFLFGIAPNDPASIAAAVTVLLAAAVVAGYIPARRAAWIDPLRAMRCD